MALNSEQSKESQPGAPSIAKASAVETRRRPLLNVGEVVAPEATFPEGDEAKRQKIESQAIPGDDRLLAVTAAPRQAAAPAGPQSSSDNDKIRERIHAFVLTELGTTTDSVLQQSISKLTGELCKRIGALQRARARVETCTRDIAHVQDQSSLPRTARPYAFSYDTPLLDSLKLEELIPHVPGAEVGVSIREAKIATHRAAWLTQRKLDMIVSNAQVQQFRQMASRASFVDSCVAAIPPITRPAWSLLGLEDDDVDPIEASWLKELEINIRSKAAVIYRKVVDELAKPLASGKAKGKDQMQVDSGLAQATPEQLFDSKVQRAAAIAAKKAVSELFDAKSKNGDTPAMSGGKAQGRRKNPSAKDQDRSAKGPGKAKGRGKGKGKLSGKGKRNLDKTEPEKGVETQARVVTSADDLKGSKGGKSGKGKGGKKSAKGKSKGKGKAKH